MLANLGICDPHCHNTGLLLIWKTAETIQKQNINGLGNNCSEERGINSKVISRKIWNVDNFAILYNTIQYNTTVFLERL